MIDFEHFSPLGALGRPSRTPRGIVMPVGDERLSVEVVRADILKLAISRGGEFEERPTFATDFELPPPVRFELEERPAELVLSTEKLELLIGRPELHLAAFRPGGKRVFESARDAGGRSEAYRTLNDGFALSRRFGADDAVFGLGEKTGALNRRGRSFTLWNVDVLSPRALERNRVPGVDWEQDPLSTSFEPYYSSAPFFVHAVRRGAQLECAGFFFDDGHLAEFDFRPADRARLCFAGGQYVEYVLAGPSLPAVLEQYTFLTGRMQLPPLWSLGHQQCRWHDYKDSELLALAREYRVRGIPCDALWLDIGHMDGFRVFTFDAERFSEPERTLDALFAEGFRTVTIVDPGVKIEAENPVLEAGLARQLFCKTESGHLYEGRAWPGRTAFPDFVKEETRAFWAELVARHAARGVSGIWNDMNEPATGAIEPFSMRFEHAGRSWPHERFHNEYALLMAMAARAGLLAAHPDERPFVLSRAGSAGIQRYAAQWLGDHAASFEHLAMGLPMALGLGISGQPFVGGDVPGFAGHATPELAARWFEYAALTPFCRCHHQIDHAGHYPWSFGAEVEAIARSALELRYRLLPYLYSAFARSAETGEPVQRPLLFDFPDDPHALAIDDQFLFGDALLVAPVLAAGARSRSVYLPPGSWLDWHGSVVLDGGRELEVAAPLGKIPLFARGGAVIPMLERAPATTLGLEPALLELHVIVPAHAGVTRSRLYEDDGRTFAYRQGAFYHTEFEVTRRADELGIVAATSGTGFPEHRREQFRVVLHGGVAGGVRLGGCSVSLVNGALVFPCRAEGFELRAEL